MKSNYRSVNPKITPMDVFRESKGLKKVIVITVPILLILNILTGITVICLVQSNTHTYTTSTQDNSEVFKLTMEQVYENIYGDTDTTKKKKTRIKTTSTPSLEFLSLLKPVVHLSGLDFDEPVTGTTQRSTVIRNWAVSEGSERSLMYNGMAYELGSITVPVTGLYFVYSHVKFYVEDNKRLDKQRIFNHSLSRYNALTSSESTLLRNKVTECREGINDGAHLEYSNDIRGIVQLNAGDQIISRVSDSDLLKHDRDWHYIGAYML